MIQLYEIKPCADYPDKIQVEGSFGNQVTLKSLESLMQEIRFKVFSIGDPAVLICKRPDCLFIIDSEGNFTLSEAASQEIVQNVINQIKTGTDS